MSTALDIKTGNLAYINALLLSIAGNNQDNSIGINTIKHKVLKCGTCSPFPTVNLWQLSPGILVAVTPTAQPKQPSLHYTFSITNIDCLGRRLSESEIVGECSPRTGLYRQLLIVSSTACRCGVVRALTMHSMLTSIGVSSQMSSHQ